jgi:nucleotide-binding universal stress UspA family protein
MKTLLAIINEPKESKDFIRYVAAMAGDFKMDVHFMYVQNPNFPPVGNASYLGVAVSQYQQNLEAMDKTAKEILAEYIKDVKSEITEDISIEYSTELGLTYMLAKDMVSGNKADMVIIGGQKNESFWLQTSLNMEIIENVECPVWIIPNACDYDPFTKIIYATDYKEEDITGLKKLVDLTIHFTPSIIALHITDSIDFEEKVKNAGFLQMLKERTGYDQLSVTVNNNNKDAAEILSNYALIVEAGLIVVLKENKSFFERIFKSDVTKKIMEKSMLPVLVLHEK